MSKTLKRGITKHHYDNSSFLYKLYYNFMCFFSKTHCIIQDNPVQELLPKNIGKAALQDAINAEMSNNNNNASSVVLGGYKKSRKKVIKKSRKKGH